MNLGGNADSSKEAFVKAMYDRLEAQEEGLGDKNLSNPEVKANLGALGQAVYDILTIAETVSRAPDAPEGVNRSLWTWVQDVNNWLQALSDELNIENLPALPEVPTELKGKIE